MDHSQRYAKLLTQVFRAVAMQHPNPRQLKIRSVCDLEAGQFLIVATGWERSAGKLIWHNFILVDVWLQDGKVVVVESNMESLLESLVAAGIESTAIISIEDLEDEERSVA
jgi:XisI protein